MPNFLRRYTWIRKEDANKNMAGTGENGRPGKPRQINGRPLRGVRRKWASFQTVHF